MEVQVLSPVPIILIFVYMINPASSWLSVYFAQKAAELEKKRFAHFSKNNAFTEETAIDLNTTDKDILGIKGESSFSPIKITSNNKYYYDKVASKKIHDFNRKLLIISLILLFIVILIFFAPIIFTVISYPVILLLLLFKGLI